MKRIVTTIFLAGYLKYRVKLLDPCITQKFRAVNLRYKTSSQKGINLKKPG
jgi:hypothetical protein